jgi:hypothetical protein
MEFDTMNIKMLKEIIRELPDDMEVFVGCQGYSNYNFNESKCLEDSDTLSIVYDGKLFIIDSCALEDANGITI